MKGRRGKEEEERGKKWKGKGEKGEGEGAEGRIGKDKRTGEDSSCGAKNCRKTQFHHFLILGVSVPTPAHCDQIWRERVTDGILFLAKIHLDPYILSPVGRKTSKNHDFDQILKFGAPVLTPLAIRDKYGMWYQITNTNLVHTSA